MNLSNQKLKGKLTFLCLGILLIFLGSCAVNDPVVITNPPSSERGYLVAYSNTGSMTAEEIAQNARGEGDVTDFTKHGLDIYTIVYNSVNGSESVEVSGLVFFPKTIDGTLKIIQNHHGTIIPGDDEEVPSSYRGGRKGSSEMYFVGATMASNGYVVSMPDYVGYGAASALEHPYTVHHELAEVSVDMLRATRQLMETLSVSFSNEVLLTGWSEGGGAGLATHQYLEGKYAGEFEVKGSSLFAGPYDYAGFIEDVLSNPDRSDDELSIYNWSIYSLNNHYSSLNRSPDRIWTYPVANQMDALYVASLKPSGIFKADFLEVIVNEADQDWMVAIQQNTLLDGWVPKGNVFFHSGTNDMIVPHYNAVNAHEYFTSQGASSKLYEYPGGDHYTPLYEYVTNTLTDFNSL